MRGVCVGVTSRKKDDGRVSTVLHLSGIKFSDYDSSAEICKGSKVESIFYNKYVDCNVGDTIVVEYGKGFQDKAVVEDITVIPKEKK